MAAGGGPPAPLPGVSELTTSKGLGFPAMERQRVAELVVTSFLWCLRWQRKKTVAPARKVFD